KRDLAWLFRHLDPEEQVNLSDHTDSYAVLGLMGPRSAEIATLLGAPALNELGYFEFCRANISGVDVEAVRLSYVGEAGWEISCQPNQVQQLFDALVNAGARPAGVFAQTSMRIEKRFLAFGHDLDTDINPFQAGLGFTLDWESDFIGKAALLEHRDESPASRLVSIVLDSVDAQPLGNEPVYHNGRVIGKTTSAAFGYRIGRPVAIALVNSQGENFLDGLEVDVDIAGSQNAGTILLNPAYDPEGSSMRQSIR
ncbi:MAG: aminomethyltransferase family protein, partial [Gammaproteobacteria bacterium]|nr:aminomethyltransferase family protein [Gammaproteobacteria bacterium]